MRAVTHLREVGAGESRPQLFLCDDRREWVLKLQGNPQAFGLGPDFIGLTLAPLLDVPVPLAEVADVDHEALRLAGLSWAQPGPSLAIEYVAASVNIFDLNDIAETANFAELGRLVVLDAWLETLDRRRPDGVWNLLQRTDRPDGEWLALDFGFALQATLGRAGSTTGPLIPAGYPPELLQAATPDAVRAAQDKVRQIADSALEAVVARVPSEWMKQSSKDATLAVLRERRSRLLEASPESLLEHSL